MKNILITVVVLFFAISINAQVVVKETAKGKVGGEVSDTANLSVDWVKAFYLNSPGVYIVDAQLNVDSVAGTLKYNMYVEKSFDNLNWVSIGSASTVTSTDTLVYFSDTLNYPYIRYRVDPITNAQKVLNTLYYRISKQ